MYLQELVQGEKWFKGHEFVGCACIYCLTYPDSQTVQVARSHALSPSDMDRLRIRLGLAVYSCV